MEPTLYIWVIDDNPENIAMIERSFPPPIQTSHALQSFLQARAALAHFDLLMTTAPERLPDFILLDYFLDRMYGHEVLDHLLERYRTSGLPRAIIIAHSSLAQANALLVERGADCALEKIKGQAQSQAVAFAFRTPEAIRWFKQHRSPMPTP